MGQSLPSICMQSPTLSFTLASLLLFSVSGVLRFSVIQTLVREIDKTVSARFLRSLPCSDTSTSTVQTRNGFIDSNPIEHRCRQNTLTARHCSTHRRTYTNSLSYTRPRQPRQSKPKSKPNHKPKHRSIQARRIKSNKPDPDH